MEGTHETQGKDGAGRDGVHQHAHSKNVDVVGAREQVPDEVSSCHALQETSSPIVSPDLASPVHLAALFIAENDPQGDRVDQQALHHRHDMDIPVDARAPVERVVGLGKEPPRQCGRDNNVDCLVEDQGEDDLMNVERQRR